MSKMKNVTEDPMIDHPVAAREGRWAQRSVAQRPVAQRPVAQRPAQRVTAMQATDALEVSVSVNGEREANSGVRQQSEYVDSTKMLAARVDRAPVQMGKEVGVRQSPRHFAEHGGNRRPMLCSLTVFHPGTFLISKLRAT
jgi:hypothetical protein